MFYLIPNFRSRIADFNAESKSSIHHIHKEYRDKVLSVGSVANQNGDMCVQIMAVMKLNYDQRAFQFIILFTLLYTKNDFLTF